MRIALLILMMSFSTAGLANALSDLFTYAYTYECNDGTKATLSVDSNLTDPFGGSHVAASLRVLSNPLKLKALGLATYSTSGRESAWTLSSLRGAISLVEQWEGIGTEQTKKYHLSGTALGEKTINCTLTGAPRG